MSTQTIVVITIISILGVISLFKEKAADNKGLLHIALKPEKATFERGQRIMGQLTLTAHQTITSTQLNICLEHTETRTIREHQNTKRENTVLYEKKLKLASTRTYTAGEKQVFDFEFIIPLEDALEVSPYKALLGDGVLGEAFELFDTLQHTPERIWSIYAHLDAQGIDLTASRILEIKKA